MSLIGVTRRVKHKNNDGTITEAEIGAYARNVSEDEDHRFVTDKEKEEWSNKVNASGGDISNVKVSQFETNSTSWPIPEAGEMVKVISGKIKKHLEDLASWRPTVSLIANIVDNCTSTNADKPLSAKQGKVLQDQITQVNSDLKMINLYDGLNDTGNNTGETYRYNVDLKKYRRIIFSFGDTTESTGGQIFVECVTPFSNFTNGYYTIPLPYGGQARFYFSFSENVIDLYTNTLPLQSISAAVN